MIWLKSAFAAASALWLSVFAASAASLPSAEGVQARFVEALGGADAITRPHSMTLKGFNLPSEPNGKRTRIPFVIYAADFKRLEVHSVPGKGDFSFGYDGKTAWALAPGAKAQIFTGSDAESDPARCGSLLFRSRSNLLPFDGRHRGGIVLRASLLSSQGDQSLG